MVKIILPLRVYRVGIIPSPYVPRRNRPMESLSGRRSGSAPCVCCRPPAARAAYTAAGQAAYTGGGSPKANGGGSGGGGVVGVPAKPFGLDPANNKRSFNFLAFLALRRRENVPSTIAEDDLVRYRLRGGRLKKTTYLLNPQQFQRFKKHANNFLIGTMDSRRSVIRKHLERDAASVPVYLEELHF